MQHDPDCGLGILHRFDCGCEEKECGHGEFRIASCPRHHTEGSPWTDAQRLPDYADLLAEQILATWITSHGAQ